MSIRYINSNDLINDVPDYLQNIINNMDCVYVDGIKPNNQHFNLAEHDKQIRADERAKVLNHFLFRLVKNVAYEKEKVFGTDVIRVDALKKICKEIEGQLKEQK